MTILLDGNAIVRAIYQPNTIASHVKELLEGPDNELLASHATIWELYAKIARGRIPLIAEGARDTHVRIVKLGVEFAPITEEDVLLSVNLPDIHRDPFDRMLVAQAWRLQATIITSDRILPHYGQPVITI